MIIDNRRKQIVRRRYRVKVAREMQVNIFHRDNLRVTAAGRTAFDAETRSETGLTERDANFSAEFCKRVRQTD